MNVITTTKAFLVRHEVEALIRAHLQEKVSGFVVRSISYDVDRLGDFVGIEAMLEAKSKPTPGEQLCGSL